MIFQDQSPLRVPEDQLELYEKNKNISNDFDGSDEALFNGISEIIDEEDVKMSQTAEHSIKFKSKFQSQ